MNLFVIGASHQTAPLNVRERLAIDSGSEAALHSELAALPGVRELAVLNTCNRVEFYGVAAEPGTVERLQAQFCARRRFEVADFERFRLRLDGAAAVQHIMEVAAGIDSQMLGETEIFGQVKDAYAAAQSRGSAGPVLHRLFQKAFQAVKHARTNSAIAEGPVSVANVAIQLALDVFGGLEAARILLLGAGEIGEKTARAFRGRGARALTVSSRRLERATALASELQANAMPFEQREQRLGEFDVVACAAAAPVAVLTSAMVTAAMKRRPSRPLLLVDLALPRNVDPAAARLDNVFLYNLDDLAKAAEENRAARETEAARCRAILSGRSEALWRQLEPRLSVSKTAEQPIRGRPAGGLAQ